MDITLGSSYPGRKMAPRPVMCRWWTLNLLSPQSPDLRRTLWAAAHRKRWYPALPTPHMTRISSPPISPSALSIFRLTLTFGTGVWCNVLSVNGHVPGSTSLRWYLLLFINRQCSVWGSFIERLNPQVSWWTYGLRLGGNRRIGATWRLVRRVKGFLHRNLAQKQPQDRAACTSQADCTGLFLVYGSQECQRQRLNLHLSAQQFSCIAYFEVLSQVLHIGRSFTFKLISFILLSVCLIIYCPQWLTFPIISKPPLLIELVLEFQLQILICSVEFVRVSIPQPRCNFRSRSTRKMRLRNSRQLNAWSWYYAQPYGCWHIVSSPTSGSRGRSNSLLCCDIHYTKMSRNV